MLGNKGSLNVFGISPHFTLIRTILDVIYASPNLFLHSKENVRSKGIVKGNFISIFENPFDGYAGSIYV